MMICEKIVNLTKKKNICTKPTLFVYKERIFSIYKYVMGNVKKTERFTSIETYKI
jgi:hypothetical protein